MRSLLFLLFVAPTILVFILSVIWGSLALWYKLPGAEITRWVVVCSFALLGLRALISMFGQNKVRWSSVYGIAFAAVLLFWNTLVPQHEDNLSPEVARQVSGSIDGDILTLTNMRDFQWLPSGEFEERWITRSYDLSKLESTDLFMSYWGGPAMAHLMVSFGFADGQYLAWSVEVRRSVGEIFSPVKDFFKANTVSLIASDEKDVVGLRSNVQGSTVYLFRLDIESDRQRQLLEQYLRKANELSEEPEFFNSVFTNCSMSVIRLAKAAGANVMLDWRLIVNGYMPEYFYERAIIQNELPLKDIYLLGDISERARETGLTNDFSIAIREGVPVPN